MASIRKRGHSYQITVSNGRRSDGSQIIETATFTPESSMTEKQAEKALQRFVFEFESKVKSGKYLDGEKITFASFTEVWFTDYAELQLAASTLQLYRHLLQAHIFPAIGHLKLSKIKPVHLNKLYHTLATERKDGKPGGYSPKTIKHVHTLISGIYSAAVKWNITTENPAVRVEPPKQAPARDKVKCFTLEQAAVFLALLDAGEQHIPLQLKLFFHMAIFCGMRRGELIALEWSDLNFDQKSVSITKSTSVVNGKPLTKEPKTKNSVRTISVPDSVLAIAREYRKEQLQYRMSIGSQWEGSNYIFIQWNGRQMYPDTPYNAFKRIIRNYNAHTIKETEKLPDIPLHGLRHTSATLLISQNIDVRTVSSRLGHAQASTTMDIYSHALQRMDEKAADTLETLLAK